MQLTFSTYEVSQPGNLPKIASRVRLRSDGRWFVISHVTDEREENGRIVLNCISLDTGSDAVLFWHEIDICL